MNAYSIGSDSPRWWWPPAATGAVGAAAIAAILVLPASGSDPQDGTAPETPPARTSDPWFTTVDPGVGRQCFAVPARNNAVFDRPLCGQRPVIEPWSSTDRTRPGMDARP